MGIVWGLVVAAVGALFVAWGRARSDFAVYRVLVARSRIFWGEGDRVHTFYVVAGALMIGVGVVVAVSG
ncbi:MAG: hypothetical protein RLZZ01_2253 [Actinomycetota bacterium]|jgi:hypothetical protein